ncbi:hypothetical protein [Phocaeicola plebeius]|uniref:hypothetical protein n=1 Tax=Phocaeicola plebeius TaxID=310297 RepID=UPI0032089B72
MIMDKLINSGILTLSVILLAIVAIIFLFLKYRQNDEKGKVHIYYISGLLIFIIIELITYVCVNNNNTDQIVDYISFASTISSLFLSVVAIIYAIVSNNQGEAQYQKIDGASDRISISVDKFSLMSESLSGSIDSILSKLDEIKVISDETRKTVSQNYQSHTGSSIDQSAVLQIIDGYINNGSYYGNLSLLACVYSNENKRPFFSSEIIPTDSEYALGYIISSSSLGVINVFIDDKRCITVNTVLPIIKEKLIHAIEAFIEKSNPEYKSGNQELYEKLKQIFNVQG